jgi:transcriptional regulator with XRE-family HTH domain
MRAKEFGEAIRAWRWKHKLTGIEMAKLTGVDHSLISRYESGERLPTFDRALEIAKAMYPDDTMEQELLVAPLGYTIYHNIFEDEDVKSFAEMLTRGNVPDEYKQASRAMVRSLVRLTNDYR